MHDIFFDPADGGSSSRMPVDLRQTMWYHIPEDRTLCNHCYENFKFFDVECRLFYTFGKFVAIGGTELKRKRALYRVWQANFLFYMNIPI
jgi:hypothetical protein